ncbi:YlxR family protein [Mesomycoplasma ovipneumoniae]|uniref:YlxR family protein n=1 Tax=Mesomycoplasma ovipneumoniae TaxID=29562 RepID=UPI0029650FDD|nr:YlxR family protein [Mesomycoplasma ovipneumoniae]MDW2924792.1 YlxR family protein [Mesomycoplasma ovipneumoniae]
MKNHTRKCIVDQKVYPINNLIRFTYINQKLIIDKHFDKKIGGRGAYIFNDYEKIQYAIKRKLFNRAFKTNISAFGYQNLAIEVENLWKNRKKESQM